MENNSTEKKWWSSLSSWMVKHQGRADYLFIYDTKKGRLNRCFDRDTSLNNVDEPTIHRLYQAAVEGRLGMLRPKDLKPQLLTTDIEKMFSSGKELHVEPENKLDSVKLRRSAMDPAIAERLNAAEELYRTVVYAPKTPNTSKTPSQEKASDGINSNEKETSEHSRAHTEKAVEVFCNAMSKQLDEAFDQEQEQLIHDLAQVVFSLSAEIEDQDEERVKKDRKAKEELVAAQNMFMWADLYNKQEREAYKKRMEQLNLLLEEQLIEERHWWKQMEDVSKDLYDMDMAGASETECSEKIRDYLDGKIPAKQETTPEKTPEKEMTISGNMWGNALRHFCRFAASEVPLSFRHIQVAEHCQRIVEKAKAQGHNLKALGLNSQERMAVQGTIEMGTLVERGMIAQAVLVSGREIPPQQRQKYLQDFLAMKGMEETLIPHVQAHEKEISTGDGPVSALQILMANRGFRADDLRAKAGKTKVMAKLKRLDSKHVARMVKENGEEVASMGRQVMLASCQMVEEPEKKIKNETAAPVRGC